MFGNYKIYSCIKQEIRKKEWKLETILNRHMKLLHKYKMCDTLRHYLQEIKKKLEEFNELK